jgi:uncharacterized protein (TIRG00374 family)
MVRRLLVAMLLGVVLYAGFVFYRGIGTIGAALASFRWSAFALALGLVMVNYLLRFWRWEIYLARVGVRGIPKLDSFFTFFSGFVLTVTPGKVGEVFKSLVLAETHDVPASTTAPIVIAERLTDVIGVVVLVIVGSTAFPGGRVWAIAGALAVVFGLFVIASRTVSERLIHLVGQAPGKVGALAPRVRDAWENLRNLTTPGALFLPTLLACCSWALEGSALYVILDGFGAPPTPQLALFAYATSILAGALIPVPGGLGVTEGLLEQQLLHLGNVPTSAATSAMILVRFATLWFAVLLGFIALGVLRARHPTLLAEKKQDPLRFGQSDQRSLGSLKVFRGRRLEPQRFTRDRVHEPKQRRVQGLAAQRPVHRPHVFEVTRRPVHGIAEDGRASKLGQVDADLVRPARLELARDLGRQRAEPGHHRHVGDRGLALSRVGREPQAIGGVPTMQRPKGTWLANACDEREVATLDVVRREQLLEALAGVVSLRDHHHTARALVEPVHDAGPNVGQRAFAVRRQIEAASRKQPVHERATLVALGGVDHEARRLVEHQQIRVLVQHPKDDGLVRQSGRGLWSPRRDAHRLPQPDLLRSGHGFPVDEHEPIVDPPLHLAACHHPALASQGSGHHDIEPPRRLGGSDDERQRIGANQSFDFTWPRGLTRMSTSARS